MGENSIKGGKTTPDWTELRRLAEAAQSAWAGQTTDVSERKYAIAYFEDACTPELVLVLLAERDAAIREMQASAQQADMMEAQRDAARAEAARYRDTLIAIEMGCEGHAFHLAAAALAKEPRR